MSTARLKALPAVSVHVPLTPLSAAIAVALGVIPVLGFVHGSITTSLRKTANVPYPHCYATIEQCKQSVCPVLSYDPPVSIALPQQTLMTVLQPSAEQFNCAQRAHSNFLENASQTMLFTLVAGLKYPELAAGIGSAWVALRSLYLYGYVYAGKPEGAGRLLGSMFWLAQGALWGLTVFGVARDLIS